MNITKALKATMLVSVLAAAPLAHAHAKPQIGEPAPAFSGVTASGETISLGDMKGKTVVLEWTNKDCPYVRKHYETANMQSLQKESKTDHEVLWVSVISSAPGTQGYLKPDQALQNINDTNASPDHLILDADGTVGKSYGAVTTPQMFIIDTNGKLTYMGGIDDKPSTRKDTVDGATNYVRVALDDMAAGREVAQAVTRPYGCSVKYAN